MKIVNGSADSAKNVKHSDVDTIAAASQVLSGDSRKRGLARLWALLGPAFIVSIAYVDPGNFATNIQCEARFGYTLLWVVVASNLMATLVQTISAKLGIATGRNQAELCRIHFPRPLVLLMRVLRELVDIETGSACEADIIVMATHGKAGLEALWAHSVAARLLAKAGQPPLLVPVKKNE